MDEQRIRKNAANPLKNNYESLFQKRISVLMVDLQTDGPNKLYFICLFGTEINHQNFSLSNLNSSKENQISPIVSRTDSQGK